MLSEAKHLGRVGGGFFLRSLPAEFQREILRCPSAALGVNAQNDNFYLFYPISIAMLTLWP